MLPGVDIQQHASGEKEMVFTQNLILEFPNQTTQVVPLRATVAVPELQLSTSWVDFGTCFVDEERVREVNLMNLSGCRSYWAVLMGRLYLPTASPTAGGHHLGFLHRWPVPKSQVIPGLPCPVALSRTRGAHLSCGGLSGRRLELPMLCVLPSLGAGQQEPDKDLMAFEVSPSSGLLEEQ
ncbi:uncharacterized protein LOC123792832 isoform X2 [Ursus americanus]|uniref:uncharacterized protein LOC123792832 isoform X2 n=1 Tax=Ursus americanus TaxID=9643 RepID=UPI001E67A9A4|nr:uncharacterized protein LOC123792832 isoform X2 [Ursus americanus]